MKTSVLVIDDDVQFTEELIFTLEKEFQCYSAVDSKGGIKLIKENQPDVVLLDLMLGNENGVEVLQLIKENDPDLPVIIITEYGSISTAIKAIKLGAEDYISKTPDTDELKLIVERSLMKKKVKLKEQVLKEEINKSFGGIIGSSSVINEIKSKIKLIAGNNNTVLITGESGTGKELVARSIHEESDRRDELFVAVNCAALPDNLIESELFGHEQGAFTGAVKKKAGKFEIASGGTIFLDEIAELKPEAQVKLMRVLQEKEFERLGSNRVLTTDARIIAATNKPLGKMAESGEFRKDLFYRLDVFPIHIAPLRERREDIPELVEYFLDSVSRELKVDNPGISEESMDYFKNYSWPGNIRELINYITRAVIVCRGKIITKDLLSRPLLDDQDNNRINGDIPLKWEEMDRLRKEAAANASRNVEAEFASKLLKKFDGSISKAAAYAGMDRTNLHRIIKRCGLEQ